MKGVIFVIEIIENECYNVIVGRDETDILYIKVRDYNVHAKGHDG